MPKGQNMKKKKLNVEEEKIPCMWKNKNFPNAEEEKIP